jgi:hypothetical protein
VRTTSDKLLDFHARRAHALTQVIAGRGGGSDNMRLYLQAIAMHALRVADPILPVNRIAALDHMDDFAVIRNRDRTRLIQSM